MALYDTIGQGYQQRRHPDARIARQIHDALGDAVSVLNVGAGAGSYEPTDRPVLALDPSEVMIRQRAPGAAPVVRGSATHLPFADRACDAALAVLAVHHWPDMGRGLAELRRVARRRVVILTCDPRLGPFWLTDYFPEILEIDLRILPPLADLGEHLGSLRTVEVPIPHDCTDGFLGAYWRRPEAYLRAEIRAAISTFTKLHDVETGLAALDRDLQSGEWRRRHGSLLEAPELDLGYRLVIAERSTEE